MSGQRIPQDLQRPDLGRSWMERTRGDTASRVLNGAPSCALQPQALVGQNLDPRPRVGPTRASQLLGSGRGQDGPPGCALGSADSCEGPAPWFPCNLWGERKQREVEGTQAFGGTGAALRLGPHGKQAPEGAWTDVLTGRRKYFWPSFASPHALKEARVPGCVSRQG